MVGGDCNMYVDSGIITTYVDYGMDIISVVMADTGDKVNRLSKHPYPKQRPVLLNEDKVTQYRSSSSSGFVVSFYQCSSNRSN